MAGSSTASPRWRPPGDEPRFTYSASPIVPSPLAGEGQGGGDSRTSEGGVPPSPNPSPQGGGESARRLREVETRLNRRDRQSTVGSELDAQLRGRRASGRARLR